MLVWLFLFASEAAFAAVPTPEAKKPTVLVETLEQAALYDTLTYPSRLIPRIHAAVLSETDGVVRDLLAPLGSQVEKNQVLAIVKNTDPVYQYAPVKVRAPVAGVVNAVEVTVGSRVTRGQKLLQITDPDQTRITVEIALSDLDAVAAGLLGEMTIPGREASVPVKVLGVSPFVDPATGTATAELAPIQKPAFRLPPGVVGRVIFKARSRQGIQIPETAVAFKGRDPFVRVLDQGKVKFVPVTLGATRRGQVEIQKGLQSGTQIVVRSSGFVADGEEVVVEAPPAGAAAGE